MKESKSAAEESSERAGAILADAAKTRPVIQFLVHYDVDDSEEIFNGTVVKLLDINKRRPLVTNPEYAKKVARSQFYTFRKKRIRQREMETPFSSVENEVRSKPASSSTSILSQMERDEELRIIRNVFESLSPSDREVIDLFVLRGKKPREVAKVLSLKPAGAVRRRKRALKRFELALRGFSTRPICS